MFLSPLRVKTCSSLMQSFARITKWLNVAKIRLLIAVSLHGNGTNTFSQENASKRDIFGEGFLVKYEAIMEHRENLPP